MKNPDPVPRPNLFTFGDATAWDDQFHMLFYVLRMAPQRIAQIDYGMDSDHPDAWAVSVWSNEIARTFPFFDARAAIVAARSMGRGHDEKS